MKERKKKAQKDQGKSGKQCLDKEAKRAKLLLMKERKKKSQRDQGKAWR